MLKLCKIQALNRLDTKQNTIFCKIENIRHRMLIFWAVCRYWRKRPKMSQRPYLRAFCKARKSHF